MTREGAVLVVAVGGALSCAFPAEERPDSCEIERGTYELFATITPEFPGAGCAPTMSGSLEVGGATLSLSLDADPSSPLSCLVTVSNDTVEGCLSVLSCAPSSGTDSCSDTTSLRAVSSSGQLHGYLSPFSSCAAEFRLAGTLR